MRRAFFGLVIFGAFALSGCGANEEQAQQDLYCEMVQAHKDSGGEYGWPDYNENFEEVCGG